MGKVGRQQEPWAIQLPGDEAARKSGDNQPAWSGGDERRRGRRLLDRSALRELADPKPAGGDEQVARDLARLGAGWTVLHNVRVGLEADIDQLVIGPAGVLSMNTKRLAPKAKVEVGAQQFHVNGYSRDYYPRAVREAARVADRLAAAAGAPVTVRPVLVITGVHKRNYRVKAQPHDVDVVAGRELRGWLDRQPRTLPPQTVALLANKARHPATWEPSMVVELPAAGSGVEVAPRVDVGLAVASEGSDVALVRWRRNGHDRLYVHDETTGRQLGWRDESTGEVHLDDSSDVRLVNGALRRWDATRA